MLTGMLEASRPRPRTSKCVLEAKGVLEDSTSGNYWSKNDFTSSGVDDILDKACNYDDVISFDDVIYYQAVK